MTKPTQNFPSSTPSVFSLDSDGLAETSLPLEALRVRWDAVHRDADAIGAMAQLAREPSTPQIASLADQLGAMTGERQAFALGTLADIEAMLETGLAALKGLQETGSDVTGAALALWCEFYRCRQALLNMSDSNRLT